jgi:hypothetical protein
VGSVYRNRQGTGAWGTRGAVGLAVHKGVAVTAGFLEAVGGTEDIMRVPEVAWMLRGGRAVCAPDAARVVGVEQGGELGARAAGVLAARA